MGKMRSERDAFAEEMKTAFMRGVCALNMEAMSMFKDHKTTPTGGYHRNGCLGDRRETTTTEHAAGVGGLIPGGTTSASGHQSSIPPSSLPHHHTAPVMATWRTEPGRKGGGGRKRDREDSVCSGGEALPPRAHQQLPHTPVTS